MLPPPTELHLALLMAFKKNMFYTSRDFTMFSAVPLDEYKTCEQWLESNFKGYEMTEMLTISNKGAPTLNLKKHLDFLL
jgi:hypothetical protein